MSCLPLVRLVGVVLFVSGFFLTRIELPDQSECDDPYLDPHLANVMENGPMSRARAKLNGFRSFDGRPVWDSGVNGSGVNWDEEGDGVDGEKWPGERVGPFCWGVGRFRKLLFVIIDALRYDFVRWVPQEEEEAGERVKGGGGGGKEDFFDIPSGRVEGVVEEGEGRHWFHNDMRLTQRFLGREGRSRLFAFMADAPTVTMQRLKGLTGGGLPTFVDVRDNFASPEIAEDNLIVQAARRGRRQVFSGDDTWSSLFPRHFNVSFPFPSFNVRDLHTVDDGVLRTLLPSIVNGTQGRWDVMVAHFLGVDHAGHRYGPEHPAMKAKLQQMDAVVRALFAAVDDDTVLAVLGDHGMTADGNHGGASDEERAAALILFATRPLFASDLLRRAHCTDHAVDFLLQNNHPSADPTNSKDPHEWVRHAGHTVDQVDLVPTLALLHGLPIPFGSLGTVIRDIVFDPAVANLASTLEKNFVGDEDENTKKYFVKGEDETKTTRKTYLEEGDSSTTTTTAKKYLEKSSKKHGCGELVEAIVRDGLVHTALNAWQVRRFLSSYAALAPDFAPQWRRRIEGMYVVAMENVSTILGSDVVFDTHRAFRLTEDLREYLGEAASLCRQAWTQFDVASMLRGVVLLGLCTVLSFPKEGGGRWRNFGGMVVGMVVFGGVAWVNPQSMMQARDTMCAIVGHSVRAVLPDVLCSEPQEDVLLEDSQDTSLVFSLLFHSPSFTASLAYLLFELVASGCPRLSPHSAHEPLWFRALRSHTQTFGILAGVITVAWAVRLGGLFSNSFIEAEDQVVLVLLQTVQCVLAVVCWRAGAPLSAVGPALFVSLVSARMGHFWAQSHAAEHQTFSSLTTALPCVLLAGIGMYVARTASGSTATLFLQSMHVAAQICAVLYWGLQSNGALDPSPPAPRKPSPLASLRFLLPRAGFLLSFCSTFCHAMFAIPSQSSPKQSSSSGVVPADDSTHIANIPPSEALTHLPDAPLPPHALHSLRHAALALLSMTPAIALLIGPTGPRTMLVFVLHAASSLVLIDSAFRWDVQDAVIRAATQSRDSSQPASSTLPTSLFTLPLALWIHLATWHWFYATGHTCSFNSLRFTSPFVGWDEFDMLRGGIMLSIDTFSSHLLLLFLLPIATSFTLVLPSYISDILRPSLPLQPDPSPLSKSQVRQTLVSWIALLRTSELACTMAFVLFARRHLMVWAIFAPKLVYDACTLFATDISLRLLLPLLQ